MTVDQKKRSETLASVLQDPKETILIFRIGSLGDTVVALPCFVT